jgi:hypothetical protein
MRPVVCNSLTLISHLLNAVSILDSRGNLKRVIPYVDAFVPVRSSSQPEYEQPDSSAQYLTLELT